MVTNNIDDLIACKSDLSNRFLIEREPLHVEGPDGRRAKSRRTMGSGNITPGINGVSVGPKTAIGNGGSDLSVRVFVDQNSPRVEQGIREAIPKNFVGLPVDVVESPRAYFSGGGAHRKKMRPVRGGVSISRYKGATGTIACFCSSIDPADPRRLVLTNAHVLGCFAGVKAGDPLYQPGDADEECVAGNEFSKVVKHEPIVIGGAANYIDAGVAELNERVDFRNEIHKIGTVNGIGEAKRGLLVIKHGRTTGFTRGVVTDVSLDFIVYPDTSSKEGTVFLNQIRIAPLGRGEFAELGDSGSLILDKATKQAVGLLFAIGDRFTIANSMATVVSTLGIRV